MTPDEYGQMLSETDTLIDRLHALYEQWFQGIERREPLKQREAIDKRIALMRTSMPNNTALRFRSQNMIQRWVTMTHHWTKISRQIEEGTYKRDVMRAKKRLAEHKAQDARKAAGANAGAGASKGADAKKSGGLDGWDLDLDALDTAFDRAIDSPPVAVTPEAGGVASSAFGDEGAAAMVVPRFTARASAAGAPKVAPPMSVARPGLPSAPSAPGAPIAARPVAPPAPPLVPGSAARSAPKVPPPPLPASAGSPPRAVAPPSPPAQPTAPARPTPPGPPPPVARPAAPPAPLAPPMRPALPTSPAAPQAAAPVGPDVRKLYDRYVEARKQNNERVDNVKFESVAASIEKMIPELQKKHQGKQIEFEVVLKDGRVGFKPVPK